MLTDISLKKVENFFSQYKPQRFKRREIVLSADELPSNVFYIISGYVRVYRISEFGEELTITILKPHDLFPISWGIDHSPNPYYLETITPLEVYKVPQEYFLRYIRSQPDTFYELASRMLNRFDRLLSRMEYLVTGRAYTKVASTILVCANSFGQKQGQNIILNIPLTHRDIAALVGITRETTCLEMKKLEKKGLIAHLGRQLIIRDLKKLEEESSFASEGSEFLNSFL